MRHIYKSSFYFLLLLSLISCSVDDKIVSGNIVNILNDRCHENINCTINLDEATNFEWDSVFISQSGITLDEAKSVLGKNYDKWKEFTGQMVFLQNGQIVYIDDYYELNFPDDNIWEIKVQSNEGSYVLLPKDQTLFNVERNKNRDAYILKNHSE